MPEDKPITANDIRDDGRDDIRGARAENTTRRTRIQAENSEKILAAALDVFARDGFRGATIDRISEAAGMSKPNLLYYFRSKDEIYRVVLDRMLEAWLAPLRRMDATGDPMREIAGYIDRKLEMARDFPRESQWFAGEIMRGAPILDDVLAGPLKALVDEKCAVIRGWVEAGKIADHDPRHLLFAIWATTQHYADFDTQIRAVLGDDSEARFTDAARFLEHLFLDGLRPR